MLFNQKWHNAPKYKRIKKPQYLPSKENLIQIIARVPNKYKPFCQLLLETGVRSKEAWMLKWSDFNFESKNVDITPVKNGEFRTLGISDKLIGMLLRLPRHSEYVFKKGKLENFRYGFRRHRANLAKELNDEEILKCSFKTFRTFFATKMSLIHKMRDVQFMLGHTQLATTEKYVLRAESMNPDYEGLTTCTKEESLEAIENHYQFVFIEDGTKYWKRPK